MNHTLVSLLLLVFAAPQISLGQTLKPGLRGLIEAGLEKSPDTKVSQSEEDLQKENATLARVQKFTPQLDLAASYQNFKFSQPYIGINGPTSNNGDNPNISLTLTYDLQKVFGPESALAAEGLYFSKIQKKLVQRDIIRNIKKTYFAILEIEKEKTELNAMISQFDKTNGILKRQRALGLNNSLEMEQFNIQRNILSSDLEGRVAEEEGLYLTLSNLTTLDVKTLKNQVTTADSDSGNLNSIPQISDVDSYSDKAILDSLSHDYNSAKLEYDGFIGFPLPQVFVREQRQWPTFPSSDGPNTMDEVGISIPLGDFLVRGQTKSQLKSKTLKAQSQMEKSIADYKTMLKTAITNRTLLKSQEKGLLSTEDQSKKLMDKAFKLYSQKRIDSLGTLDIFQKYLQSSRAVLANHLLIQNAEADLEYLSGNPSHE